MEGQLEFQLLQYFMTHSAEVPNWGPAKVYDVERVPSIQDQKPKRPRGITTGDKTHQRTSPATSVKRTPSSIMPMPAPPQLRQARGSSHDCTHQQDKAPKGSVNTCSTGHLPTCFYSSILLNMPTAEVQASHHLVGQRSTTIKRQHFKHIINWKKFTCAVCCI